MKTATIAIVLFLALWSLADIPDRGISVAGAFLLGALGWRILDALEATP